MWTEIVCGRTRRARLVHATCKGRGVFTLPVASPESFIAVRRKRRPLLCGSAGGDEAGLLVGAVTGHKALY
eukprot:COSAG06_NODE_56328_length_285_cov_0.838710_1_plen_70_part_10